MSKVLTSLNHFVFTYLDDVPIYSTSWEEHLQHLNAVVNRCKTAPKSSKARHILQKECMWVTHRFENQYYLNSENILKRKILVNNLEVNTIVIPAPLVCTLLYEFHNCKGHQGSTRTFNMLKWKFWWKGMRLDVKNHIKSCITCSKNLAYTAHHLQLHFEIPKVPFACIAIYTISKLPTTSSSNKYPLTCIDLLTSYIIAVPIPNKTAESVVEAYLSGIHSRTGASMVCLSDNRFELKNSQMNTVLKQLGIKHIFSNPYRPAHFSWFMVETH